MEECGKIHILNELPPEKETLELSQSQRRFWRLGEEKIIFQVPRIKPRFLGFLARSQTPL